MTLDCEVQGHPQPFITWYQNDAPISHGDAFHVFANGSLWIEEVKKWQDQAIFTCEARSDVAMVTATAVMTVLGEVQQ